MGKSAEEWQAEHKCHQHAEKENDVSRLSKKTCRSTESEMGEGEGGSEEDRLKAALGEVLTNKATRRLRGDHQPLHRLRSEAAQLD